VRGLVKGWESKAGGELSSWLRDREEDRGRRTHTSWRGEGTTLKAAGLEKLDRGGRGGIWAAQVTAAISMHVSRALCRVEMAD
jgi:hypothetical protein